MLSRDASERRDVLARVDRGIRRFGQSDDLDVQPAFGRERQQARQRSAPSLCREIEEAVVQDRKSTDDRQPACLRPVEVLPGAGLLSLGDIID
jgi:hypothetical protein